MASARQERAAKRTVAQPLRRIPSITPQGYPVVFELIAHFCNHETLLQLSEACKDLHKMIRKDHFWKFYLKGVTARLSDPKGTDQNVGKDSADRLHVDLDDPGPSTLGEAPANFQDPRNWALYSSLSPCDRLAQVVMHMNAVKSKIEAECKAGAGDLKQIFIGMLEANGCDKHVPDDFTDDIMCESMSWFIWSQFKDFGPFSLDVFEMLHGSFSDVSWGDTAVRDSLFNPIVDNLGYGTADPHGAVVEPHFGLLEFFGTPGILHDEPWRLIKQGPEVNVRTRIAQNLNGLDGAVCFGCGTVADPTHHDVLYRLHPVGCVNAPLRNGGSDATPCAAQCSSSQTFCIPCLGDINTQPDSAAAASVCCDRCTLLTCHTCNRNRYGTPRCTACADITVEITEADLVH